MRRISSRRIFRASCALVSIALAGSAILCAREEPGAPLIAAGEDAVSPRRVVSLDGRWEIAEGGLDSIPAEFLREVPVPGLVDLARPPLEGAGRKSERREAFWYRRRFRIDGPLSDVAILKIHKARYGARVYLNGELLGDHLPCFTPAWMDARKHLRGGGQENELVIRVGAHREQIPSDRPSGWDFEKYLYIPGIYDSVELILTGSPRVASIQTAPDLERRAVRVYAELAGGAEPRAVDVRATVREASSMDVAGEEMIPGVRLGAGESKTVELSVPIAGCRLWTPELPCLYELAVSTGADVAKTRFGMRTFRFDRAAKRAMLNDEPIFLRGTNVTLYRFFEDDARKDLPWRADWVRALHRKFRSMHWNSLRYCIGFPPELWYDIADEEGFLIQDEFPIWLLGDAPEKPSAENIIPEYAAWMRERWNHPSVVIWDAQNESHTAETGRALAAVRGLDRSSRPWENGWAEPQSLEDCVEAHPYLFIRAWQGKEPFRLREMAGLSGEPFLNAAQKKLDVPVIINEYGWLWLTREGDPTCLTSGVYESLLGPRSTVEERRRLYARHLAALTEFWRCHRRCAGVLHFCGLGYSRPGDKPRPEGGATSDHFLDVEALELEPLFEKHVGDAFEPVGLLLDFWEESLPAGSARPFEIVVINDLAEDWSGRLRLRLAPAAAGRGAAGEAEGERRAAAGRILAETACCVGGLGREVFALEATVPDAAGDWTLAADLIHSSGKTTSSLRDVRLVTKQP